MKTVAGIVYRIEKTPIRAYDEPWLTKQKIWTNLETHHKQLQACSSFFHNVVSIQGLLLLLPEERTLPVRRDHAGCRADSGGSLNFSPNSKESQKPKDEKYGSNGEQYEEWIQSVNTIRLKAVVIEFYEGWGYYRKYLSCGARWSPKAQGPAKGSPSTYPRATVDMAINAETPQAAKW